MVSTVLQGSKAVKDVEVPWAAAMLFASKDKDLFLGCVSTVMPRDIKAAQHENVIGCLSEIYPKEMDQADFIPTGKGSRPAERIVPTETQTHSTRDERDSEDADEDEISYLSGPLGHLSAVASPETVQREPYFTREAVT
ncbi:hypothetical protein AOLI_G00036060 [Acnodon oligacanthus]